ncbi:MAG: hypothetical protein NT023_10665 [Armatimonadetes bacterium]|nr:hypothetical protein [Armatimonadota bacterium]
MTTTYYHVKVRENRLLELPEEAQELGLQPGEEVVVSVSRNDARTSLRNEAGFAAMREISESQKSNPAIEGSDIVKLVREAREGTMYGVTSSD